MTGIIDVTTEVTNEFCECFETKKDCTGFMARLIADSELPVGVNPNDIRVKQIIEWCKENTQGDKE